MTSPTIAFSALEAAVDAVAAADVWSMPCVARAEAVRSLHMARERLNGQYLRALAAFDADAGAQAEGHLSTAGWLREALTLSAGQAKSHVDLARLVRDETVLGVALEDGDVSFTHAAIIRKGIEALPAEVAPTVEVILVNTARASDPTSLREFVQELRHSVAPILLDEQADDQHERRFLHASKTIGGMVRIDGQLDPESGEDFLSALHTLSVPSGPEDERTPQQRRADGLSQMARFAMASSNMPDVAGEPAHVSVVVDLPTLLDVPFSRPGRAEWTGVMSPSAVRVLLCDASVSRIITDGPSQVLDVGRSTRTVSAPMRRALAVRDGGCIVPGCHRPPRWCDGHHVRHWLNGGVTSLDNLVLLCRRHHRAVHRDEWRLLWDSAEERWVARRRDPVAPRLTALRC
ncbi:MAG: hypothetical protein QOF57_1653 [Frankiaceae bacterium]|nr:hypothetical protein [Frankiaceae bacterium]